MVKIKVPATTANIGPGFDTLGMALTLFQEIIIERAEPNIKRIIWPGEPLLSHDRNLVVKALERVLKLENASETGYVLNMFKSDIPISRGLGSSAAAIVSGIMAANYLLDYRLSMQNMLNIATEMEGHPDNVAPALLGNLIIAATHNDNIVFSTIKFPENLNLKVLIPDFELSTERARSALPSSYKRSECIYNLSRISFLTHALLTQNYDNLSIAFSDLIHEPYRYPLIEDSSEILIQLSGTNAFGHFISGAGPTIISVIRDTDTTFDQLLQLDSRSLKHRWECLTLTVNSSGAQYEQLK